MKAAFIADARQGSMHDFSKHDSAGSIIGGFLEGDPFQALARIGAGHGLHIIREGEAVRAEIAARRPAFIAAGFQRGRGVVRAEFLVLLRESRDDGAVVRERHCRGR